MLELYITNKNYSSWSLRPWLLMRELDIPFTEKLVEFRGDGIGSSFDSFSPTAKVPCLIDRDTVVWESLAIVEYLAEKTPAVWPLDSSARAWARCASAEMHAGFQHIRDICSMNCGLRILLTAYDEGLKKDVERIDELWSEGLFRFGGPFLAGSAFTAVDAFFAPIVFRAQTYGLPLSENSREYMANILALASMQEWYQSALSETWRDEGHEDEARRAGVWLEDLRA